LIASSGLKEGGEFSIHPLLCPTHPVTLTLILLGRNAFNFISDDAQNFSQISPFESRIAASPFNVKSVTFDFFLASELHFFFFNSISISQHKADSFTE